MTLVNSAPCAFCGELKVPGGALFNHEKACSSGGPKRRRRSQYRELFFANSGAGPYDCYFSCGNPVDFSEVVIHHVNEDHLDNRLDNLVPAHRLCHNGYHLGRKWETDHDSMMLARYIGPRTPFTDEVKAQISATKKARGQAPTDEARAAARQVNIGSKRSLETRAQMSDYAKNRTPEHQERLNAANRGRVVSPETREKMSIAAKARRAREKEEK